MYVVGVLFDGSYVLILTFHRADTSTAADQSPPRVPVDLGVVPYELLGHQYPRTYNVLQG